MAIFNQNGCELLLRKQLPKSRIYDDSHSLFNSFIYDLRRTEFIDDCALYPDYPEFIHFNQDAFKLRTKGRQRWHYCIFDISDKGIDCYDFVAHAANKQHFCCQIQVCLDANDNGRFAKKDNSLEEVD